MNIRKTIHFNHNLSFYGFNKSPFHILTGEKVKTGIGEVVVDNNDGTIGVDIKKLQNVTENSDRELIFKEVVSHKQIKEFDLDLHIESAEIKFIERLMEYAEITKSEIPLINKMTVKFDSEKYANKKYIHFKKEENLIEEDDLIEEGLTSDWIIKALGHVKQLNIEAKVLLLMLECTIFSKLEKLVIDGEDRTDYLKGTAGNISHFFRDKSHKILFFY